MNHLSKRYSLCTVVATSILASVAAAQAPSPNAGTPNFHVPVYKSRLPGILSTRMWDWTTETWNGDDKPYQQARLAIDQVVSTHQDSNKLLVQYKVQAQRQPDNPLALFRWAYTAYQVMLTLHSTVAEHKVLDGVQECFYHTPSPHTYNYARMQFLVYEFYTSHRQAVPVAKRLLAMNSDDYHVEYDLGVIYLNDYVSPDFNEALGICNHLKRRYPTKPSIYALTGETYALWWYKDKNPAYVRTALENYNKYLQIAPPEEKYRKQVKWIIGNLTSQLKSS